MNPLPPSARPGARPPSPAAGRSGAGDGRGGRCGALLAAAPTMAGWSTGWTVALAALVLVGTIIFVLRKLLRTRLDESTDAALAEAARRLGSESLNVRLTAVQTLDSISARSPERHWRVTRLLTEFVRERAPGAAEPEGTGPEQRRTRPAETGALPADLQAAFRVLARRSWIGRPSEEPDLDLSALDLRMVALPGGHLEGGRCPGTRFEAAELWRAHLEGANLLGARLESSNLARARLDGASLRGASLVGANLEQASLRGADLSGADLSDARLTLAHLEGARLVGSVGLTAEQLEAAYIDASTELPENRA